MGLAERRAIKEFQDNILPDLKKKIDTAAGFEVALDVDWDTLAQEDYGHMYNEAWEKVYFQSLEEALKSICADDMGKEALQESLKSVAFKHTGDHWGLEGIKFDGGVLTVDHAPITNIDDIKQRADKITEILEKSL